MLSPAELTQEHLTNTYTKAQLEQIAVEQFKLEISHKDTKPKLIARILEAAAIAVPTSDAPVEGEDHEEQPDNELDGEDLDEGTDEDEQNDAPQAPAPTVAPVPDTLKKALAPYIAKGLRVRIGSDNTFFMQYGNKQDSGTLDQPVEVIARCAKRLLP